MYIFECVNFMHVFSTSLVQWTQPVEGACQGCWGVREGPDGYTLHQRGAVGKVPPPYAPQYGQTFVRPR